jgi:hypothetical protein
MKKIISTLVLLSILSPVIVLAVGETSPQKPTAVISTGADLISLISNIGNWVFAIVLAVASVFLIVAGFMFVTAGGNPENVNKARQMLVSALIGVAVAIGALGLVQVIKSILGYTGS